MADKPKIEVIWKEHEFHAGKEGCFQARMANNPNIVDYGKDQDEAVRQILISLKSWGLSGNPEDYEVVY